jgi:mRNA-degrading endonuclease toxin of MazEF toxin-antitoxin module
MKTFNKTTIRNCVLTSTSSNSNINKNCEYAARYARGTVWWVNMEEDPMCPNMQQGERPVLIYSNNLHNNNGTLIEVIPLTSSESHERFVNKNCIKFNYDGDSYILANMIKQINQSCFKSYYFTITDDIMEQVEHIRMKVDGTYDKYVKPMIETKAKENVSTETNTDFNKLYKLCTLLLNPDKSTDIADNTSNLTEEISNLKEQINILTSDKEQLTAKCDNLSKQVSELETENALYKKVNEGLSEQCNKLHLNKIISTNTSNDVKTTSNRTTIKYNRNSLPRGYWLNVDNNIQLWNDFIVHGLEYCMKKYDYSTKAKFDKRKSNAKIFLISQGYNVKPNVIIKKNDALS